MLASRPTCALARVSYMKSTRAKAPHSRELSGPVLPRDMDPFYPAIDRLSLANSQSGFLHVALQTRTFHRCRLARHWEMATGMDSNLPFAVLTTDDHGAGPNGH